MKIVLLEDVDKLGKAGDIVDVKAGFGRNYLIKNNKGLPGTRENVKEAEARKAEIAKKKEEERQAAIALAEKLDASQIVMQERASEDGTLFGSVTNKNIAEALEKDLGLVVDIKTTAGVEGKLTVIVTGKK